MTVVGRYKGMDRAELERDVPVWREPEDCVALEKAFQSCCPQVYWIQEEKYCHSMIYARF